MKKSTQQRIAESSDRMCKVDVDVLALGAAVLDKKEALRGIQKDIEASAGDAWASIPYSRAASYFDAIELMIIRKGVRTMGQKLIEFDKMEGVLKMTTFGQTVMKKLESNIRGRLQRTAMGGSVSTTGASSAYRTSAGGIILPD